MNHKSYKKVSFLIPLILFLIVLSFSRAASQTQRNIIMVELYEWGIDLSSESLPPGPVNIFVTNVGTRPHNFRIEGQDTNLSFPKDLPVGQTLSMQLDLQGGEYQISDSIADYAERGMQATLEITGEQQNQTQPAQQEQTTTPEQSQQTMTPGDQQGGQPTQAATAQASPSPGEEDEEPEDGEQSGEELVQQGQEVFSSDCAQCHGQNGEGQVGPALAGSSFVTQEDPAPVIDVVTHGRGQMPAFEGQLSSEEIAAVVSFIRGSWGNNAEPVTPDDTGDGSNDEEGQTEGQAAQEVTIDLAVEDNAFSQESIIVPAGAQVVMNFINNDNRPHNFSVYRSPSAMEEIFLGKIVNGPDQTVTYEFTAPAEPGEYYFQCDVHPYMNGIFNVEE